VTKITDWVSTDDKTGEFKRQRSSFRDWISREAGARYAPEKGRYHLYVSYACPWVSPQEIMDPVCVATILVVLGRV
jgi:glutathionyl-hydroquinone reductase